MEFNKSPFASSFWKIFDEIHSGMDASQYINYVVVLLFIKYVSDRYTRQTNALVKIPKGGNFSDIVSHLGTRDIGENINKVVAILADTNDFRELAEIVDYTDDNKFGQNKKRVDILSEIITLLNNKDFDFSLQINKDKAIQIFEYLLKRLADIGPRQSVELFTPPEVVKLMVGIAKPEKGMKIYDPTCGSGGFLIQSKQYLNIKGNNVDSLGLYGQDINMLTYAICKMNLILHDISSSNIYLGDTLLSPFNIDGDKIKKFDRILSNPPFNLRIREMNNDLLNRFRYGVSTNADWMFVQHMIASLNLDSKIVTVLSSGCLFRGLKEEYIRTGIIKNDLIEAVISLSPKLFYGTSLTTNILVINNNKPTNLKNKILFINAEDEFENKNIRTNILSDDNIKKILLAYEVKKEIGGFSRIIGFEELENNNFNLNVSNYINPRLESYLNKFRKTNNLFATIGDKAEIRSYKKDTDIKSNSIFIPKFAKAKAYDDLNQIEVDKRKNYFVLSFDETQYSNKYLSWFFNSDVGTELRDIFSSGTTIPFLTTFGLSKLFIPTIPIKEQRSTINNIALLNTLSINIGNIGERLVFEYIPKNIVIKNIEKLIADDPLEFLSESLPFPIGTILIRAINEKDEYKKHVLLLNYFEALSIFITTIQLSGIYNAVPEVLNHFKTIINRDKPFEEWFKNASFGNWSTISLNIAKKLRDSDLTKEFKHGKKFVDLLCNKELLSKIDSTVKIRNEKSHEGLGLDKYYKEKNDDLFLIAQQTGDILIEMFQNSRLIIPKPKCTDYRNDKYYTDCFLLMGSNQNFKTIELTSNKGMSSDKLYLQELESEEYLELLPFIQMGSTLDSEKNAAYFYNSNDKNGENYISYVVSDDNKKCIKNIVIKNVLEYFSIKNPVL